ncbi:hypothetical protein C5167_029195, partial [Papaver somniferum]
MKRWLEKAWTRFPRPVHAWSAMIGTPYLGTSEGFGASKEIAYASVARTFLNSTLCYVPEQGATANSCTAAITTESNTTATEAPVTIATSAISTTDIFMEPNQLPQAVWVWNYELKARDYGELDEECLEISVWEVSASF